MIALGVALIISSNSISKKYKYLLDGEFTLSFDSKEYLELSSNKFKAKYIVGIIIGFLLFLISSITSQTNESLTILVFATSIFIFIYFGNYNSSLKLLLKLESNTVKNTKTDRFLYLISSTVWKLTVCFYLILSYIFNIWNNSWVIFPIVAISLSCFRSIYKTVKGSPSH